MTVLEIAGVFFNVFVENFIHNQHFFAVIGDALKAPNRVLSVAKLSMLLKSLFEQQALLRLLRSPIVLLRCAAGLLQIISDDRHSLYRIMSVRPFVCPLPFEDNLS